MTLQFPESFVWGTATSAFQIEGAAQDGQRGESIWDRFCKLPNTISDGSDGKVACDHYHRFESDIELLAQMRIQSYRFSVAWPRILPNGTGKGNEDGLSFYDRLVDRLLDVGIDPMVTLYHWDLPQVLQDRGGWPHRDTAKAFVDYAHVVARRLGDRVRYWVTHNEPWCIATLGHLTGEHAPGMESPSAMLHTAHHVLLSHGWSVPVIRDEANDAQVGIVVNLVPAYPASQSEPDLEATSSFDGRFNRWYLDPLYKASYPTDIVEEYQAKGDLPHGPLPFVEAGDLTTIGAPTDFLGINYYSRAIVRSDAVSESANRPRELPIPPPNACTDMGWEIFPDGLADILNRVHKDYSPEAIYITENGCAYPDSPDENGEILDARRITYLEDHLRSIHSSIESGVPVKGYYLWSFLDNFEWAFGYSKRFGLVWVDFSTQERKLKASARRYREIIENGSIEDR